MWPARASPIPKRPNVLRICAGAVGIRHRRQQPRQAPGHRVRPRLLRVSLWTLAVATALTGLPAALTPRAFYDSFPLGLSWVDELPPYNQHLVTDVGGFYLAFAALFAWAAVTLQRALILPLVTAWSLAATLHFVFHVTHLNGFDVADAVGQTAALGA